MLQKLGWLVLFSLSLTVHADVTLQPIMQPKDDPLPITIGQPPIPCDQIIAKLVTYNQLARQHDQSLTAFLSDVSTKVGGWYALLSPLENTTQTLPAGTFATLQDGADKISQITDMAFDNSDLLAQELDHIIGSMRACAAPAPTSGKGK